MVPQAREPFRGRARRGRGDRAGLVASFTVPVVDLVAGMPSVYGVESRRDTGIDIVRRSEVTFPQVCFDEHGALLAIAGKSMVSNGIPIVSSLLTSSSDWVCLPEPSVPSMTINFPLGVFILRPFLLVLFGTA